MSLLKILNSYISPKNILVGIFLFLLWPKRFSIPPGSNLDWSWILDLNWAFHKNFLFGKDWVFTYGPLGWLVTRVDYLLPTYHLLFFDLLLMFTLGYVLNIITKRILIYESKNAILSLTFSVFYLSLMLDPLINMLLLLLFCLFEHHHSRRAIWIWVAISISILGFFIKFNMAFIYIFLVWMYLTYAVSIGYLKVSSILLYISIQLLFIYLGSVLLNVYLPGYIIGGLHIISGYNDAMNIYNIFLENNTYNALPPLILGFSLAILLWLGGLLTIKSLIQVKFDVFIWVSISISFFVLFKHAFTYYGQGPANEIFAASPALLGIGFIFLTNQSIQVLWQKGWTITAIISILGIATLHAFIVPPYHFPYNDVLLHSSVGREAMRPDNSSRLLDSTTTTLIGQSTVDIFPENIDFLLYNNLNHLPRPSVQAYIAGYSPYLLKLNQSFLLSDKAPDYILYQTRKLETPLHESTTRLAYKQRYILIDTSYSRGGDTLLVLKKKNVSLLQSKVIEESSTPLNKWRKNKLPQNGLNWVAADIEYNLWGKIRRFFFQPPKLWVEVRYSDGTTQKWPVMLPTVSTGMPTQRLESFEEMNKWLMGIDNTVHFTAIRFYSEDAGFKPDVKYRFTRLETD